MYIYFEKTYFAIPCQIRSGKAGNWS